VANRTVFIDFVVFWYLRVFILFTKKPQSLATSLPEPIDLTGYQTGLPSHSKTNLYGIYIQNCTLLPTLTQQNRLQSEKPSESKVS